jgi:hypothetical protein
MLLGIKRAGGHGRHEVRYECRSLVLHRLLTYILCIMIGHEILFAQCPYFLVL